MNIGMLLPHHARYRPDHLAIVFDKHRLTHRQFNLRTNRLANALSSVGIQKGDKIATILPNCLELLEIYLAVAKIGAVVVPLSPMLRGQGLVSLLNDSDSVIVITDATFAPILDDVKNDLPAIASNRYLLTDEPDPDSGYQDYHVLCSAASDACARFRHDR